MSEAKKTSGNEMWGGRFEKAPSDIMQQINASIDVDKRLWRQDIEGSKVHCEMLMKQKIIAEEDGLKIIHGLNHVAKEIEDGTFVFSPSLEDIHMNIEHRLKEIIGDAAGKLHTARSRNDQAVTDFRLWVRGACDELIRHIETFQAVLMDLSEKHAADIMPGFTHLQVAQPVTLGMHLDAYWQMMDRDKSRLADCRSRLNVSPLGACALSGTGFPTDRNYTAKKLGFDKPMQNTMDAVSARDFALEFLFCCAQCGLNLSRLAEEIILWATPQFHFMNLSDEWSTGSSIMPQKKNPDAAELVRGKAGDLTGHLMHLMMVMKGLPLTYNKDQQDDKEPVFKSFDMLTLCLLSMKGMLESATFYTDSMRAAADSGFSTATEIADWLVRNLAMPFRDAHHVTGRIVKLAEQKSCKLDEVPLTDMQEIEPRITDDIFNVLNADKAIASRMR